MSARPAMLCDATRLPLRGDDAAELALLSGISPVGAVRSALSQAREAWAFGRPGESLLALAGVRQIDEFTGHPWVLLAPDALPHARSFLRCSRLMVASWHRRWPLLVGWTWSGNAAHHRFLRHMGFSFINTRVVGPLGAAAYEIVRIAP